ncbi:MoxR-like ATPase [Catenuloplanes nepalensis]|uniref:MoxR-like ATPase n=1 Tax=Catenuloplanes nepalensis TaxID=587533 RepID=A0ABT9MN45_9ACTN|nr:MoxR family ATPase [Catenuloplanes nepalensis]MDP9792827.1 MoxR-like ATPase [Catenuloplanes nepalensis]
MTDEPLPGDAGWKIYRGDGRRHDGISRLPDAPPWRRFDGETLPPAEDATGPGQTDHRPGADLRAEAYRPDPELADMVNAAIYLRRPLLVTGKPGTGKSTLALSVAWELQLGPVLYWPVTSRSQVQESLYRYDAVGRLQKANLQRLRDEEPSAGAAEFIGLGPLGTALVARDRPRVLLVDEFDKGDIDLPNDLLNVLEEGEFTIPELARERSAEPVPVVAADGTTVQVRNGRVRCHAFPVIIITSNGEREFPHAFRRRCLHARISAPSRAKLETIVREQLGAPATAEVEALFNRFIAERDAADLPTDRLLNAIYLALSGLTSDQQASRRVIDNLFAPPGSEAS